MPAPDDTKIQVNFRVGETLINVYAANPDELVSELTTLESLATTIAATEQALKVGAGVGSIAAPAQQIPNAQAPNQGWGQSGTGNLPPGGFAQNEQQGPPPAWAQGPGPAQGAGPGSQACAHGAMTWKQGVSKTSGKPYSGWFCPSRDRSAQCKPVFA